jgi:hypothetical protein
VATILSIALDPFAQQLIQTKPILKDDLSLQASILMATRYDKGFVRGPPSPFDLAFADADLGMKVAIFNGMSQSLETVISQTNYVCPTGNCTFAPFRSLAVCSSCNLLDQELSSYADLTTLINELDVDGSLALRTNGTTFRTSNNLIINNADGMEYLPLGSNPDVFPAFGIMYMTAYSTANASKTASFQDSDLLIWSTTILRLNETVKKGSTWPDLPILAQECSLHYCVKSYEAEVSNGKFTERETVDVSYHRSPDSWQVVEMNFLNSINYQGADYRNFANDTSIHTLEYTNRTAGLAWTDLSLVSENSQQAFNVSDQGVHGLSAYIQEALAQNTSLDYFDPGALVNGWYINFNDQVQFAPLILEPLGTASDTPRVFETLARSMSNAIRASNQSTSASDNSTSPAAAAQTVFILYTIEWGWISLHVALILIGIIFLLFTMWETSRLDIPVWKTHSLPPLAFPDQIGHLLSGVITLDGMEERAEKHIVRLVSSQYTALPTSQANHTIRRKPVPSTQPPLRRTTN